MLPVGPSSYFRSERPNMIRYSHILITNRACLDSSKGLRHFICYPRNVAASLIISIYVEIVTNKRTFVELARQFSDCPWCLYGGDHGWVPYHGARPHIKEFPFKLQPGEMTLPVSTPDGFQIFLRTE